MEHCKLQIGCMIILLYIAYIYLGECKRYHKSLKDTMFDELLILGIISVTLDGITAFTVNHLDLVNPILNMILHALFLIGLDSVVFGYFLYMLYITGVFPKSRKKRVAIFLPFLVSVVVVVLNIGNLEYREGVITNYSMGISAYTCFAMVAIYISLSIVTFFQRWNYTESHKRASIITYLLVIAATAVIQMIFPEVLITSIMVTVCILGIYMNQEDPALTELSRYHADTVMSFANLIENRDNNTGGHIRRTSQYVKLIADGMREKGYHKNVFTKDYVNNLVKAAPMHDIGKISVPDAVLQKPGKLTDEEYDIMKKHSENGGKIIMETFSNFGNEEFPKMAYEVARYHHEKWNGRGYPEGLKGEEIPLHARIMAVADVFDAVSEKRCYREAMPLDKCFEIIEQGSGQDFDPQVVEVFMEIRSQVESVHENFAKM